MSTTTIAPGHRKLRLFDRHVWALIIVVSFPIGPMLYLMYGKAGPGRFS